MRARSLKPGLFKNELLGQADPLLTILFQGLWCLADRSGRLEDRPLRIKAEVFPYREALDVNGYLTELARLAFVVRYEVAGKHYIQIVNFSRHQNPHKTERLSTIPPHHIETATTTVKAPCNYGELTAVAVLTPDSGLLTPDSGLLTPDSPFTALRCAPGELNAIEAARGVIDELAMTRQGPKGQDALLSIASAIEARQKVSTQTACQIAEHMIEQRGKFLKAVAPQEDYGALWFLTRDGFFWTDESRWGAKGGTNGHSPPSKPPNLLEIANAMRKET